MEETRCRESTVALSRFVELGASSGSCVISPFSILLLSRKALVFRRDEDPRCSHNERE